MPDIPVLPLVVFSFMTSTRSGLQSHMTITRITQLRAIECAHSGVFFCCTSKAVADPSQHWMLIPSDELSTVDSSRDRMRGYANLAKLCPLASGKQWHHYTVDNLALHFILTQFLSGKSNVRIEKSAVPNMRHVWWLGKIYQICPV